MDKVDRVMMISMDMDKTIISFLNEAVEKYGDRPFLYEARRGTDYTSLSYKEV